MIIDDLLSYFASSISGPAIARETSFLKDSLHKKIFSKEINYKLFPSLEAQVASISDDIAYNNHDIQDGINANLFKLDELIEINFFNEI